MRNAYDSMPATEFAQMCRRFRNCPICGGQPFISSPGLTMSWHHGGNTVEVTRESMREAMAALITSWEAQAPHWEPHNRESGS